MYRALPFLALSLCCVILASACSNNSDPARLEANVADPADGAETMDDSADAGSGADGEDTESPAEPQAGQAGQAGSSAPAEAPVGADDALDALDVDSPEPELLQAVDDDWRVLLTGDWELPAGTEGYYCARLTLPEDVYFSASRPVSPPGTHHTVLSLDSQPGAPDGIVRCTAGDNGDLMIAGSGVGTNEVTFPEGVAMLAPAGSQLVLNLHLFNATEAPLRGRSGTLIRQVAADEVEELATSTLAGTVSLTIPPGQATHSGRCTFRQDVTLFAVGPHMHQLGAYMKVVAHSSEMGDVVMYDDDYDFEEQRVFPLEPITMRAGDSVDVECTYDNDSDRTVTFGDSSRQEMCFAGLLHYPADARRGFICLE